MIITWKWLFKTILKNYAAITIFPFIFTRENPKQSTIVHEKIHLHQQIKFAIIFFYIAYVAQYLFYRIKYGNHWKAYYSISFEQEAYKASHPLFKTQYNKLMET